MRKLIALAAVAMLAIAVSCDTANVGAPPVFFAVNIDSVVSTVPGRALFGSEPAVFTATRSGGVAPFNYSWNFGGASTPNTAASPAGDTTQITATLTPSAAAATYTITVTATDGTGTTATDTFTINVGPTQNAAPVVNSATWNPAARTITVVVEDADDGETLNVTAATVPAGFAVDAATKAAAATGPLTAVFNVTATDVIAGATGDFAFTVSDGTDTSAAAPCNGVSIPAFAPAADALYATPLSGSAATGAEVTVLVISGDPANPFQYVNGIGLTIDSDAAYVANSFNVGAVGGATGDADGMWATMAPGGGFLLAPDNFITATDIGGGRERWDFNITPLGGSNQAAISGPLMNAKFTFAAAGAKTFGFQDVGGVKRTYYSDDATEYFWGNIANDGTAVANSVTIN